MELASLFRITYVTTSSVESASHIARILVSENLAAACTIIPNSINISAWDNSFSEKHESILLIKTHVNLLEKLNERLIELHHDEVPEIFTFNIQESSSSFLKWMESALSQN